MNRHLVLAANGFVLWAFGLVIALFIKDYPWVGTPVMIIGGVLVGYGLSMYRRQRMLRAEMALYTPDDLIPRYTVEVDAKKLPGSFCPSCGQRAIYWKRQHGFLITGLPALTHVVACPDWDSKTTREKEYERAAARGIGSLSIFGREGAPPVEPCGNVVYTTWMPGLDHDHPAGDVSLDCIRCVMEMEKMGAIDATQASDEIARIIGETE